MDTNITQRVNAWLNGSFDEATKNEIKRIQSENPDDLPDAFYRNLEFGTGGLRGIMGVGTNRINKYTVGMATRDMPIIYETYSSGNISVVKRRQPK